MSQDKATIQEAAKALSIDRKTIYRWIDKGLISKVKEGSKTFVILSEVRAICDKMPSQDSTKFEAANVANTNIVTLERPHYEGLLIKLGQFEAERRYLLEYKEGIGAKDKELAATKEALLEKNRLLQEKNSAMEKAGVEIQKLRTETQKAKELDAEIQKLRAESQKTKELEAEIQRLKSPFWKRIFSK